MRTLRTGGRVRAILAVIWALLALAAPTRLLAPILAALLVIAGTLPAAASAQTRYLALGDSLAWGDGASNPQATAYVPLFAEYVAGTPHGGAKSVSNLAIRGETTASFVEDQLDAAIAAIADPSDTRVATLSLGGNDVGVLLNDPSDVCLQNPADPACLALVAAALHDIASRYPTIVGSIMGALAADDGDEQVYVMTVYNPFGGLGAPYEDAIDLVLLGADLRIDCAAAASDPMAGGLNDIIACTALAFGAVVVDAYPVIGDNALALTHIAEGTLDTHPNDEGYALLAKAHRLASR